MHQRKGCVLHRVELVNSIILKYFMQDLKIGEHFEAIRLFLLLEDGEFGHALTDSLFHKVNDEGRKSAFFFIVSVDCVWC